MRAGVGFFEAQRQLRLRSAAIVAALFALLWASANIVLAPSAALEVVRQRTAPEDSLHVKRFP